MPPARTEKIETTVPPPVAVLAAENPVQLASIAPVSPVGKPSQAAPEKLLAGSLPAPGDEWEYVAKDIRFGGKKTLVERVKAVVPGTGVLEEFLLDGQAKGEWVFDGRPSIIGVAVGEGVMFSSHWSGQGIENIETTWAPCSRDRRCRVTAESVEHEKVSVPAGSFDTLKLNIAMIVQGITMGVGTMNITAWYSVEHKRVIKQALTSQGFFGRWQANETIELAAIRAASR